MQNSKQATGTTVHIPINVALSGLALCGAPVPRREVLGGYTCPNCLRISAGESA